MLKNEKFHHLNEKELENFKDYESDDKSLNGDDECTCIPFTVHYSKQVLKKSLDQLFEAIQIC